MAASNDTSKSTVVISPLAYTSTLLHAAQYGTAAVHGILLGSSAPNDSDGNVVTVTKSLPVCHETPTKPLIDTALSLVQASLGEKETIVGWYTAPELLQDERPGPVALRIVAALDKSLDFEPVLLVVQNEKIPQVLKAGESSETGVFKVYGKDFGKQWLEPLDDVTVTNESGAARSAKDAFAGNVTVTDLVEHFESPDSKPVWPSNTSLVKYVEEHC